MDTPAVGVAAVIVLAAGEGTRMKSRTSKLLHRLGGRSLLAWSLDAAAALAPDRLVVVVGQKRDQVEAHLDDIAPTAIRALQDQPLGTGHAVQCGLQALGEVTGEVVVTYGDVPLLKGSTLEELVLTHRESGNAVTMLTAIEDDPAGYGRVIRDEAGGVEAVVEHRDAGDEQLLIQEINGGIYVFDAAVLTAGLADLRPDNSQGELYLTDVIAYARAQGSRVGAMVATDLWQVRGVNDRLQLAELNRELNRRIVRDWMLAGVTIIDPATTWIEHDVSLEPDAEIWPGSILRGATTIAAGAVIGPDTRLTDVEVGPGAQVIRSEATLVVIGPGAQVGPFSYLRPGTELGADAKVGAFVETKKARIGAGSKVPHLTYCGDAVIGEGTNIGAGVIFANYDGERKSTTTVGSQSFVGSDSVLVAPVTIADGSFVAAGSVITGDVGPGELAVARGRQQNLPDWVDRRRPGSKTAQAAAQARARQQELDGADNGSDS